MLEAPEFLWHNIVFTLCYFCHLLLVCRNLSAVFALKSQQGKCDQVMYFVGLLLFFYLAFRKVVSSTFMLICD